MNQNKKVNLSVDLLSEVMLVNSHNLPAYNFSDLGIEEEKTDKKISCGKGNFHKKEVTQSENYEKKQDKYNKKTGFQNVNIQNEK